MNQLGTFNVLFGPIKPPLFKKCNTHHFVNYSNNIMCLYMKLWYIDIDSIFQISASMRTKWNRVFFRFLTWITEGISTNYYKSKISILTFDSRVSIDVSVHRHGVAMPCFRDSECRDLTSGFMEGSRLSSLVNGLSEDIWETPHSGSTCVL